MAEPGLVDGPGLGPPVGVAGPDQLGLGLLWRPELAALTWAEVRGRRLGFVEVIAESIGRQLPPALAAVRDAGARLVPHGVGLGLGGADRPDRRRLARLAQVAEACAASLVSEHLAFVRAGPTEAGHLLPIPRTRDMLDVLVDNVRQAQAGLPVRLALEPVASLVDWPGAELTEVAFLSELLDRADVDLVLDVANMVVNAANRRRGGGSGPDVDPMALVDGLPLDRVAYVHAAGGRLVDGRHHDTHTDPLWPEVEVLVEELWARHEIPGLLLERDGSFPDDAELRDELARLDAAASRGRSRPTGDPRRPAGSRLRPATAARGPSRPGEGEGAHGGPGRGREGAPRPLGPVRRDLAVAQATLLRAVTEQTASAPGFDPSDLEAVASVLARKRMAAVRHAIPDVAVLPCFAGAFPGWARRHPVTRPGGAGADASAFLRALPRAERTPDACRAVVRYEVARSTGPGGRRLRGLRVRSLRGLGVTVVGVGLGPWKAVRTLGRR